MFILVKVDVEAVALGDPNVLRTYLECVPGNHPRI
jgi:hypothetical protein